MNIDSHFLIGHSHDICEDYAESGVILANNHHYAIVSDGCSASNNVDIGSRILCRNTIKALEDFKFDLMDDVLQYEHIGNKIILYSEFVAKEMGLTENALDATLIFAVTDGKIIKVFMYGDGYITVKYPLNVIVNYQIEYTSNAPYYLSYQLNKTRLDGYKKEFKDDTKFLTTRTIKPGFGSTDMKHDILCSPTIFTFDAIKDGIEYVAISSDGISSLHRGDSVPLDPMQSIRDVFGYKNYSGAFVKRRMKMFKKDCETNGHRYEDDIAVATISFK